MLQGSRGKRLLRGRQRLLGLDQAGVEPANARAEDRRSRHGVKLCWRWRRWLGFFRAMHQQTLSCPALRTVAAAGVTAQTAAASQQQHGCSQQSFELGGHINTPRGPCRRPFDERL